MQISTLLAPFALTTILMSGTALAQDESAEVESGYPQAVIDRPLTLPQGMGQITGELAYQEFGFFDLTAFFLDGRYGVTDKLQVSVTTALLLDPEFEWFEQVIFGAAYSIHDTEKLDVALGLAGVLDFNDGADSVFGGAVIDVLTRYRIDDKLFLLAGDGLVGIDVDPFRMSINANLGLGYQATPEFAVTVSTQPLSIGVGDNTETTSFADFIPVTLDMLYSLNQNFDLFGRVVLPSLEDASDFYSLFLGANIRI